VSSVENSLSWLNPSCKKITAGVIFTIALTLPAGAAADELPSNNIDRTGDFDHTLPASKTQASSPPTTLRISESSLLRHTDKLIANHRCEIAIKFLSARLRSEPTNKIITMALIHAHRAYADELCSKKEFEKACAEYQAAFALVTNFK
jgi:hypothetical protein